MVSIYPHLPMLHVALLTSDDDLGPRLEEFRKNHGKRLRTPFRQFAGFLLPMAILLVVLCWSIFT
ncbi:MAG TPA: hypothetical protein VGE68_10370 [Sphingomicrobium sp.]